MQVENSSTENWSLISKLLYSLTYVKIQRHIFYLKLISFWTSSDLFEASEAKCMLQSWVQFEVWMMNRNNWNVSWILSYGEYFMQTYTCSKKLAATFELLYWCLLGYFFSWLKMVQFWFCFCPFMLLNSILCHHAYFPSFCKWKPPLVTLNN